jgi:NADP-dependent 3-hydroxy acid dehydrogenase YdfG
MNICIVDFRQDAIDAALPFFEENGWPARGISLDVSDRAAYVEAADEAEAIFGKIHLLVNNAGIGINEGNIWESNYDDMDFAIEMNFKSVLNGVKTVLPRILKHGESGHVISTSSTNGIIPVSGMALYNSTKRAVMALMETLAIDLRDTNVGVSVFCPGPFRTNILQSTAALRAKKNLSAPPSEPPKPTAGDPAVKSSFWRNPDDIGDYVVQSIQRGDLFIFSHSEFKPGWEAYAAAVAGAFPDTPYSQAFMNAFDDITRNPMFPFRENQRPF